MITGWSASVPDRTVSTSNVSVSKQYGTPPLYDRTPGGDAVEARQLGSVLTAAQAARWSSMNSLLASLARSSLGPTTFVWSQPLPPLFWQDRKRTRLNSSRA